MEKLFDQKIINANNVFEEDFLDVRILYLYSFNMLPSIHFISHIDAEKAFEAIREKFAGEVKNIHRRKWYKRENKSFQFDTTILVMNRNCVVELNDNWCEILHDNNEPELVSLISEVVLQFKERERRQPLEINLIVRSGNKLELKSMEINRRQLNLNLFYEDDFQETDKLIRKRLNRKKDKGIVLLHGLPGTGKTTYLRFLIGRIKKRVLFLSPSVVGNLMNPELIDLLINNPDTVLIIEDADNVIEDRRYNPDSSVSNLLNISDGLLADFLNVQLICTFNSSVKMVDGALMRAGRLIAKYEFGKLGVAKGQKLSDHFGFSSRITQAMTIAEIANQHEKRVEKKKTESIGFRWEEQLVD